MSIRVLLFFLVITFCVCTPIYAQIKYNYIGTNWFPADPDNVSTANDNLTISAGIAIFTENNICNDLIIEPGAGLNLGTYSLVVEGSGILKADASGYSQIIGDITGTITWESYLTNNVARWFNVAFAVNASLEDVTLTNGAFLQANGGSTTNIWRYDGSAVGPSDGQGDWAPLLNLLGNTAAAAYSIYLGPPNFGSLPTTISVAGTVENGPISRTLYPQAVDPADGYGWNFVRNPYPSCVDWSSVVSNNPNVTSTYWILNANSQWVAYNSFAPAVLPGSAGPGPGASAIANRYLAPGQGYFVQSNTATTLNYFNSDRVLNQSPALLKTITMPISITLVVVDSLSGQQDYTFAAFNTADSDLNDRRKDGIKRFNDLAIYPALYTTNGTDEFLFNFTGDAENGKTLDLSFEYNQSQAITLSADFSYLPQHWSVYLEDNMLSKITDLRAGDYVFQHNKDNQPQRFLLHINQQAFVDVKEESLRSTIYSYMENAMLNISLKEHTEKSEINIYTIAGNRIIHLEIEDEPLVSIDMKDVSTGIYVMNISADNGTIIYSQKIIK